MTGSAANILTLNDFLTGEIDLCSVPEVFMRVTKTLDDDTKDANDLAKIIQQDPSLSARMLRIVNSAFFGFPATVKSIDQAITILGNREIRLLVMTTSVVEKFSNMPSSILNMREFWSHSLRVALFAKFLAERHPKKRQLSSVFITVIATEPLTSNEQWTKMAAGEFSVFHLGKKQFTSLCSPGLIKSARLMRKYLPSVLVTLILVVPC